MLTDTHLHLTLLLEKLEYLPEKLDFTNSKIEDLKTKILPIVENLLQNHTWAIEIGVNSAEFLVAYDLLAQNPKLFFSYGIHPENVQNSSANVSLLLENLETFLAKPKVVAIGECGLDYYYTQDLEVTKLQKQLFEAQIQAAIKFNLPLIIHCRDAFSDLFEILDKYPAIHGKFVVHCFTGNSQQMAKIVALGGKIGIGGIVTFNKKNEELVEAVKNCPVENILIETDLPFLAPIPFRGKTCLPQYISFNFEKVAQIKGLELETFYKQAEKNALNLFKLEVL
jgi:TatD DNase family protein